MVFLPPHLRIRASQEEGNSCSASSHEVVQVKNTRSEKQIKNVKQTIKKGLDTKSKNQIKKEKQVNKNNFDYLLEVGNGSSISKEVYQTLKIQKLFNVLYLMKKSY